MSKSKTYTEFVEKFKPKLTTDDCYTPPAVYDAVLKWVRKNANIGALEILRPFYPGGDYKSVNYPRACVVIDNPPFSILAEIVRYYVERDILFFLFAPQLTLFSSNARCCRVVTDSAIKYENGAVVKTSFTTNLFPDTAVMTSVSLHTAIKTAQKSGTAAPPKYSYPNNVVTVSRIASIVSKGVDISIPDYEVSFCWGLDSQKKIGKSIFGAGYLVGDNIASMLSAAEKAAESILPAAEKANVVVWCLSDRERNIIDTLNSNHLHLF
jgi:hypothetical protein